MTTSHMSGIVDDTVGAVKSAAVKVYDNTIDKVAQGAKDVVGGGTQNVGINPSNGTITVPTTTTEPKSDTTKTVVIVGIAAVALWAGYKYFKK